MANRTINTEADYIDDQGYSHSAGDIVSFAKGQIYTKRFKLLDDGTTTKDSPIIVTTHGTGADPIFRVNTTASGWITAGTNLWTWTNPGALTGKLLLIDDTIICHRTTGTPTAEYEFQYNEATEVITLYAATDPDTRYTTIEFADTGDWAFKIKASHVVVDSAFKAEKSYCMFFITDENAAARENVTVSYVESEYCHNAVYIFSAGAGATLDNVTVKNSYALNSAGAGFRAGTPTVSNVTIKDCVVDTCGVGESFGGVYVSSINGGYVTGCSVTNSIYGKYYADGAGYYTDTNTKDVIIENNIATNCEGPLYQDNSGNVGNKFISNIGINVCSTTIDDKNVNAINFGDSDQNDASATEIYNNTVINPEASKSGKSAIRIARLSAANASLTMKNNIFVGFEYAVRYQSPVIVTYDQYYQGNNIYKDVSRTAAALAESTPDTNFNTLPDSDIVTDPLLDSNYIPYVSSPCYRAGTAVGFNLRDYQGHKFKNPPSIGAYELAAPRMPAKAGRNW